MDGPEVVAPVGVPGLAPNTFAELRVSIREAGLLRPRRAYYIALGAVLAVAFGAVVAGLVLLHDSWWALLLAPFCAVLSTQIAFLAHDVAHYQVVRGRRLPVALSLLLGNLLNGFSYGWWVAKHDAHHAHPNSLTEDPDVRAGAFVFDADQASLRTGFAGWAARHQAELFFPALTLEALNLRISSLQWALGAKRRTETVLLVAHLVGYLVLVFAVLTPLQAIAFMALHQALFGLYLGCSFAPSHKGMPPLSPEQAADPVLRQVLTSRNIRGGRPMLIALGGLNYQIEHHLFPTMPRPNLPAASQQVRALCHATGIAYTESSLLESYGIGLRHLHAVGEPLRNSPG